MGCIITGSKGAVRPDGMIRTSKREQKMIAMPAIETSHEIRQKERHRDWVVYQKIVNAPRLDLRLNSLCIRRGALGPSRSL